MKRLSGRSGRLIACTLVSATLAAGTTAAQSFHLYWDTKPFSLDRIKAKLNGPSVLLSHELGASPFTGVARYEGPVPCTAVFIETTTRVTKPLLAPAYVLTAAHCVASLDPNEVLIDRPAGGRGRVVFNDFFDSPHRRVAVRVARIAYLTMKGQDLAVLELEATHADLRVQLIRPWPVSLVTRVAVGDPIAVVSAPRRSEPSEDYLRLARCRVEGVARVVVNGSNYVYDAAFNQCRDVLASSAGSPVISFAGRVIGTISATTTGAPSESACASGHPCNATLEKEQKPDTSYVTSVAGVTDCFDVLGRFNLTEPGCRLDPGTQVQATPSIGAVNPHVRQTWQVTVNGPHPFYRYAIINPAVDDCRTTRAYSGALSVKAGGLIDAMLPPVDGFAFLCVWGQANEADTPDRLLNPTVLVARVDTKPPHIPAQVTIDDVDVAWRVTFRTVPDEVSFQMFKIGNPQTVSCQDPAGYEMAPESVIGLPKASGPYLICAIPYDAALNAGRLFERRVS